MVNLFTRAAFLWYTFFGRKRNFSSIILNKKTNLKIFQLQEVFQMTKSVFKLRDLLYVSLFGAVIAVCSWISVPFVIPFTLQTFAVFCAAAILGTKRGTAAVLLYILLGAVGLPVFSGFRGGVGVILGTTGGYITGFVLCALITGLITDRFGHGFWVSFVAMALGLIVCYIFGTLQYVYISTGSITPSTFAAATLTCVAPFIVPDIIKITLAVMLSSRLYGVVNR